MENKFQIIVKSFINGQIKQGKKQLKKLTLDNRVDFIESYYFDNLDPRNKEIILKSLVVRDFN